VTKPPMRRDRILRGAGGLKRWEKIQVSAGIRLEESREKVALVCTRLERAISREGRAPERKRKV